MVYFVFLLENGRMNDSTGLAGSDARADREGGAVGTVAAYGLIPDSECICAQDWQLCGFMIS